MPAFIFNLFNGCIGQIILDVYLFIVTKINIFKTCPLIIRERLTPSSQYDFDLTYFNNI